MKKLSIKKLEEYLNKITKAKVMDSIMIWGAPGIGKSSVVSSVAQKNDLRFIDVRLSQLAPTDIEVCRNLEMEYLIGVHQNSYLRMVLVFYFLMN